MINEFQFTAEEVGKMANLVQHFSEVPTEAFDGDRHRDMAMSLSGDVWTKLRNNFDPFKKPVVTLRLTTWQTQIIFLALKYSDHLTGSTGHIQDTGRLIMQIQPKLLHS